MTLFEKSSFSVPSAPSRQIDCPDGVHHFVRGRCLRCTAPDPLNERPQHDLDEREHLGRS